MNGQQQVSRKQKKFEIRHDFFIEKKSEISLYFSLFQRSNFKAVVELRTAKKYKHRKIRYIV